MAKILVVDDEVDLCEILKFNLENLGYVVDTANSAEEALTLDIASYSLLLLDVMMDKMSGFAMAAQLKKNPQTAHVPIIFVTAKDTENDTLTGFNIGADDYISKPFRLSEVSARVKAVLRRTAAMTSENIASGNSENLSDASKQTPEYVTNLASSVSASSVTSSMAQGATPVDDLPPLQPNLVYDDLVLNVETKRAMINNEDLMLTKKEYELLYLLLSHRGRIFSRDQILHRVWPDDVMVLERSVDVNIARLRKKLGTYADYIVSRSGYGYSFNG